MGRVEQFKHVRSYKQKCFIVGILFFLLTFLGILVSDYAVNSVMKDEKKIRIFKIVENSDRTLKVNVMNKEVNIRYKKIYEDFQTIKNKLLQNESEKSE